MASLHLVRHARVQKTGDGTERWSRSEEGLREAGILARQGFWRGVEAIFSILEPKALETVEPAARR